MLNNIFESIYIKSKWAFLSIQFFSVFGIFSFVSLVTGTALDSTLAISFSLFTSVGSALFTANKIADAKKQ